VLKNPERYFPDNPGYIKRVVRRDILV